MLINKHHSRPHTPIATLLKRDTALTQHNWKFHSRYDKNRSLVTTATEQNFLSIASKLYGKEHKTFSPTHFIVNNIFWVCYISSKISYIRTRNNELLFILVSRCRCKRGVPEDTSSDDLQYPWEVSWYQRYAKNCLGSYRRGQTVPKRWVLYTFDTLRDILETLIRFIKLGNSQMSHGLVYRRSQSTCRYGNDIGSSWQSNSRQRIL